MDVAEARRRLDLAEVPARDVRLPGEEPISPRQGAIVVRRVPGSGAWDVLVEEQGQTEVLARTPSEDQALQFTVHRLTGPPPRTRFVDDGLVDRGRDTMRSFVEGVVSTTSRSPGTVVQTSLWDGAVVDRFGTLDGFLVWPEGTPFAQRSLPPDVLDPDFPELGRLVLGCAAEVPVLARVTAPWFGQPGGAVVMRLERGTTVRDLVRTGRMLVLEVPVA